MWLDTERIVVSDTDDDLVTLVAEQGDQVAVFTFDNTGTPASAP